MSKKQLINIVAIGIIIAGFIVTIFGILKYQGDTKLQQPVLEEYRWDNDDNLQSDDIVIESAGEDVSNSIESGVTSDE